MIDSIYPNRLPITYDKESAPAQRMNTTNMIKADLNTFDCKIGQTTNYSTKFFSMLCNYERDSREYNELVERIKLLRRYIGDSIDAGKGIKTKPFPSDWKSWKRVPEDWSEEQKAEQWFLNNLVEKRKPYFFIYIYETEMEKYKKAKKQLDRECKSIFGVNFNELKARENKTQEEKNFVRKYYNELPVTKTPCIMNKMAWRIEGLEFDFKHPKNTPEENLALAEKMMNGEFKLMKSKMDKIRHIYKEWKADVCESHKKPSRKMVNMNLENADKAPVEFEYVDMTHFDDKEIPIDIAKEQYALELEEIIPNDQELADYLVHMAYESGDSNMKAFCWMFGGNGIVKNILEKNNVITVPVDCEDGVEYLGRTYDLQEVFT